MGVLCIIVNIHHWLTFPTCKCHMQAFMWQRKWWGWGGMGQLWMKWCYGKQTKQTFIVQLKSCTCRAKQIHDEMFAAWIHSKRPKWHLFLCKSRTSPYKAHLNFSTNSVKPIPHLKSTMQLLINKVLFIVLVFLHIFSQCGLLIYLRQ